MATAPSMPLFVGDYLADTMHLTLEQHGAYLKMLMVLWRQSCRPIPDDDDHVARILGVTASRWRKAIRPAIEPLFDAESLSEKKFRQKRLEKEWEYVSERAEKMRENGRKGGRPKLLEKKETDEPTGSDQVIQQDTQQDNLTESTQPQPHIDKPPIPPASGGRTDDPPPRARKPRRRTGPPDAYPDDFEAFWRAYPDTVNNTKWHALREWEALSPEDCAAASAALPAYAAHCRKTETKFCHAERFLKNRRFEGFAAAARPAAKIEWPDAVPADLRADLETAFGPDVALSWFGQCAFPEPGVVVASSRFIADKVRNTFGFRLRDILGVDDVRIVVQGETAPAPPAGKPGGGEDDRESVRAAQEAFLSDLQAATTTEEAHAIFTKFKASEVWKRLSQIGRDGAQRQTSQRIAKLIGKDRAA